MPVDDRLFEVVPGGARTLIRQAGILHELTAQVTLVLDVALATVSLSESRKLCVAAASAPSGVELSGAQASTGVGPGMEAWISGEPCLVADLSSRSADWPAFVAEAEAVGIAAVASIPMRLDGEQVGVLDLYDESPRIWSGRDVRVGAGFADLATSYVLTATALERQQRLADQLQHALDSRVVIEQAKGILAARNGISVDEAFELLRRHARSHNADIHATARAVIDLGLRL